MKFLGVARVLIVNQLKAYRVHRHLIVLDLLILLGFAPFFLLLIDNKLVVEMYRMVTSLIPLEELKRYLSAVISALIFLDAARMRGKVITFKEHHSIFLYPVSVRDFLFGRILSEIFTFLKFSIPFLLMFYSLTYISGSLLSALLAYSLLLLGLAYLSAVSSALRLLGLKNALIALSLLSILDILTGKITASFLFYVVVDAIYSCYTSPNLLPFSVAFITSFTLLAVVSGKVQVDVEVLHQLLRSNVRSEYVEGILTKSILELKRTKLIYTPILAVFTFSIGKLIASYLPNPFPSFVLIYVVLPIASVMEYYAMQEAAVLWLYRVSNSVSEFARSIVLKTFLSGALTMFPILAFFAPLSVSLGVVILSVSFVAALSVVCSLVAVKLASEMRISVKFAGVPESRAVAESIGLFYFFVIFLTSTIFAALIVFFGHFALLAIFLPFLGVKIVEYYAEEVSLR